MKIVINTTKSLLPRLLIITVFCLILIAVISYARGYRFNLKEGKLSSTGIISINSSPRAATIFINDELKGATDSNITLPYGAYKVKVKKEGYSDWGKDISLKGEIVMSLNALLFSKSPSLTPLTTVGITKASPVGNFDKILLVSHTEDIEKDGIYLFEPSTQPVTIFPPLKLILLQSLLPKEVDINSAEFEFDPSYQRAVVTFSYLEPEGVALDAEQTRSIAYLISIDQQNVELFDITASKDDILAAWEKEKNLELVKVLETLPDELQKVATESFYLVSLSPDEKKIMYVAKNDATVPLLIAPPLIGANQVKEERDIKTGNIYIYDKKEDKNFRVPLETPIQMPEQVVRTSQSTQEKISETPASPIESIVLHEPLLRLVRDRVLWYPTSD
nr:PEGA domain-containing protein [Candidatus Woesebacteria bacterium]